MKTKKKTRKKSVVVEKVDRLLSFFLIALSPTIFFLEYAMTLTANNFGLNHPMYLVHVSHVFRKLRMWSFTWLFPGCYPVGRAYLINCKWQMALRLRLCTTLLAPSSIDNWKAKPRRRCLTYAQYSFNQIVQPSIPLPLVTLSSSSIIMGLEWRGPHMTFTGMFAPLRMDLHTHSVWRR